MNSTLPVKVFITRGIPEKGPALLRANGFQVSIWPQDRPMSPAELLEAARDCQAFISLSTDPLDDNFLSGAGHLDIISQFAAGYDNIHLPTATSLGIAVANTPDALTDATADIAFGLMIAVSRKMFYMHKSIEAGNWDFFRPLANLGMELKNKTLGIFGLGRIGREMALRCKGAYQMEILYCNRQPNPRAETELGARRVSFDQLLDQSDVLSVHSVLSDQTRGIFNLEAFRKMKKTAIFINTSRGAVHREEDLLQALLEGEIWGAGLDVTHPEPMRADHPLLSLPNTAILPHIGSATLEARTEMSRVAAQNIIDFYRLGQLPHLLNPGVRFKVSPGQ